MNSKRPSFQRLICSVAAAAVMLGAVSIRAAEARDFDIPAGELSAALKSLARETGLELIFKPADLRGIKTQGVKGTLSPQAVIVALLEGTALKTKTDASGAILISAEHRGAESSPPVAQAAEEPAEETSRLADNGQSDQQSDLAGTQGMRKVQDSAEAPSNASANTIQEIVVTAQKRVERLQDVPVPVAVIDGRSLVNSNQLRMQDYYTKVPGLGLALTGDGGIPTIALRGITTGGITNPTVAIVVDELPYGSSTNLGGGYLVPDIDPSDLARVEVLRGPQGTLYGANSIGGLVKFVTIDPSTDGMNARVQAGVESVAGGEEGSNIRAAVNLPIGDTFAVRASGFTGRSPGYVDNIQTGEGEINHRDNSGGRLSALWRPSEAFSLKLSAMLQDSERYGTDEVDTRLAQFQRDALRSTGGYGRTATAYSVTMNARLGSIDLVSATGYSIDKIKTAVDVTLTAGGLFSGLANSNFGVTGAASPFNRKTGKFTQELRASLPLGERVEWLVGAFYTDEEVSGIGQFTAMNPATGGTAGVLLNIDTPSTFRDSALFTNVTFQATDRFDIQLGGRVSENRQSFSTVRSGPLQPVFFPGAALVPEVDSKDTSVTYQLTPRLKLSPDLMVYGRFASGYRPGGPNSTCGTANIPCAYDADTTTNYEIGFKGSALDRALYFDASVYYIDWKDIQIQLIASGLGFTTNASRAESKGVELSLESRPLDGLVLSAWAAYNNAELTENIITSNLFGRRGDRLPYSSRVSGNLSVDQDFPLGTSLTGFVGGTATYVDDRTGTFKGTAVREIYPSYTQVDLRAGVRFDTWTCSAFVNNLGDKRGVLRGGLDATAATPPVLFTYIQPRTVGLSLTKTFE